MSPLFSPATLKTILNNAPFIIQGAEKLISLIRNKNAEPGTTEDLPMTVEGLKQGLERLEQRLEDDAQADIEQIQMIETLARQNEALAESLKRAYSRLNLLTALTAAALLIGAAGLILVLLRP